MERVDHDRMAVRPGAVIAEMRVVRGQVRVLVRRGVGLSCGPEAEGEDEP